MGIRRWKDHRGREKIYLSRQWPDRTRLRRLMPNMTLAKQLDARIDVAIAAGQWRTLRDELTKGPTDGNPTLAVFAPIYLQEYCRARNRDLTFKEDQCEHIVRILGSVRLKDFRRSHAHDFVVRRSQEVKPACSVN